MYLWAKYTDRPTLDSGYLPSLGVEFKADEFFIFQPTPVTWIYNSNSRTLSKKMKEKQIIIWIINVSEKSL
jgi:hypothetical protein